MTSFHVVIPARYQSSRLPGKLLMDLNGMTVIERVYRQALLAGASSITIATDSEKIFEHATEFGAQVVMTATTHQSGTERIAEVIARQRFSKDAIIVNVQGDEPLISPVLIKQVASTLSESNSPMATLCWPIETLDEMMNPNVVKVVRDYHNNALYFSRSRIPANRDNAVQISDGFRHIGLYAYRASFLLDYVNLPVCSLEAVEALEQLRVLWAGYKINVATAVVAPQQDINTLDDLQKARENIVNQRPRTSNRQRNPSHDR